MSDKPTESLLLTWMERSIENAPTSEPVAANKLWRDGGTLKYSAGIPPAFTTHPQSQSIAQGNTVTFTWAATNATSFQLQKQEGGTGSWANVSGATTSPYTSAALTNAADNGDKYRVVAVGPGGTTNSNEATLTVTVPYYFGLLASDAPATVDEWPVRSGSTLGTAFQHTVADQPSLVSGKVRFDGSTDNLFIPPGVFTSRTNVPDASGGTPGEGFTITGITRASDGTIWASNDGRGLSGTNVPSLVHLSSDGGTKLGEILILPLYPSAGTIQGIAIDPDGSLWCVSTAEKKVHNVSTAGAHIRSIDVSAITGSPNGLAYNVTSDRLVVSFTDIVRQINPDTGAVTDSLPNRQGVDQMTWTSDGTLFATSGTNRSPGALYYLLAGDTGWNDAGRMKQCDAMEGVIYDSDKLMFANDGFFHSAPIVAKNQILRFNHPFGDVTVIELHAKFTLLSTPSGSRPVIELGGVATGQNGIGMYVVSGTNNQIRIFANTAFGTTERAFATKTCAALTTESIIRARINFTAKTVTVWQNGTQIGSADSIAAVDSTWKWRGGGRIGGVTPNALNMDLAGVFVTPQLTDEVAASLWS